MAAEKRIKDMNLWNTSFHNEVVIPENVSEEAVPAQQIQDILDSSPSADKTSPFKSTVDERLLASVFG